MEWEIFLGLLSIALGIFFGLYPFKGKVDRLFNLLEQMLSEIAELKKDVTTIRNKTIIMEDRTRLLLKSFSKGTVEVNLKNLGRVKVTADPYRDKTVYFLDFEQEVLIKEGIIDKKSKETGLTDEEVKTFGGEVKYYITSPRRIVMEVPSSDSTVCVKFIARFLRWLDEVYVESLEEAQKFEKLEL